MNSNKRRVHRPTPHTNEGRGGIGGVRVNTYTTLGALGSCMHSCPTIIQPVCPANALTPFVATRDEHDYDEHDLAAESIERYTQREGSRRRRRREDTDKRIKMAQVKEALAAAGLS
jgi:hypothetical protein